MHAVVFVVGRELTSRYDALMGAGNKIWLASILLAGCVGEPASPPDPGFVRMPATCSVDTDCNDGLVCNGEELCGSISGRCVSGLAMLCDDGLRCTRDLCEEPGVCTSEPDDSVCGAGFTCREDACVTQCPSATGCDPYLRCGCPSDEACSFDERGAAGCGAAGTARHGEECAASGEARCIEGDQCVSLDFGAEPPREFGCRTLCMSDADCDGDDRCGLVLAGTAIRACTQRCDIVDQTGCIASLGCHPVFTPEGIRTADCVLNGIVPVDGDCVLQEDCVSGSICVSNPDTGGAACSSFCAGSSDCPPSHRCTTLTTPFIVDGTERRVCVPR